jgi:serine/threonine protein kinase
VSAGDPLGLSGKVLHEQFYVNELADESPRAFLYKGTALTGKVPVAIKFVKVPNGVEPDAFVKRFRHESRLHYALAKVSPHVVDIHASGSTIPPATGMLTPFSVLEWLHGRTLAADFAERRAHWGKGRSIQEAITLLDPAVDALAVAHFHNVIHREVTPANLFLADVGDTTSIKVLDFGLAKVLGDTALDVERAKTIDRGPLASPIYAAPEQFSRDAGAVGPAADLYSLVMIFLEALRDQPVMDDSSAPLAVRVLDPKKRPTPRALGIKVGDYLELAIAEAVAVHADQRPKEISEFWANLKRAALKDARAQSISSPPSMRSRADSNDDDETEVAINLSFVRPSAMDTVSRPEPDTLSRPMDENETLSSTGEMFAMKLPEAHEAPTPAEAWTDATASDAIKETLVSPKHPSEPKPPEIGLKPTLLSGAPPSTKTAPMPREQAPSTAAPFDLTKRGETPVVPMTQGPRDVLKRASLNQPIAMPPPVEAAPPPASTRPMWLTALLVFVIVATGLGAVVAAILSQRS